MAKQIRDTQIIKTPEGVIDPDLYVPDDVVGIRAAETEDLIPDDPDNDYLSGVDYDAEIVTGTDPTSIDPGVDSTAILAAPQTVSIASQTVKFTSDGTTVVDVVLSVEDVMGATSYEVRLTAL